MRKKDKLYTIKQPINLYDEGGDTNEEDSNEKYTNGFTLLDIIYNGNRFSLGNTFSKANLGSMAKSSLDSIGTAVGQIGGGLISGGL